MNQSFRDWRYVLFLTATGLKGGSAYEQWRADHSPFGSREVVEAEGKEWDALSPGEVMETATNAADAADHSDVWYARRAAHKRLSPFAATVREKGVMTGFAFLITLPALIAFGGAGAMAYQGITTPFDTLGAFGLALICLSFGLLYVGKLAEAVDPTLKYNRALGHR